MLKTKSLTLQFENKALSRLISQSQSITISTPDSQSSAIDFLSKVKTLQKVLVSVEKELKDKLKTYQTELATAYALKEREVQEKVAAGSLAIDEAEQILANTESPQKVVVGSNGGKIQFRTVKRLEIVDATLIPRKYLVLSPDHDKIRKALLEGTEVPGAVLKEEKETAAS